MFWAAMDFCRDGGNEEAFYRLIRLGSLGSGAGSKAPLEGLRRLGRKSLSDPAGSEALCRLFARIGARSPWAEAAELLLDSGAGMAQAGFELAGRGLLGDEKESWNTALELFRMDPRVGAEEAALTDLAARKGLCDWWGKAGVAGYCCGAVGEALRLPERLVAWRKDGESLASRASKRRNWWFVLWLLEGGWDCESDGRDGLELWRRAEFSAGSDPGARACLDLARASLARKECEGLLEATGRGRDGRKSGRL